MSTVTLFGRLSLLKSDVLPGAHTWFHCAGLEGPDTTMSGCSSVVISV